MFKELMKSRLPTGRAWQNPKTLGMVGGLATALEEHKDYVDSESTLRRNFINFYSDWQKIFNLLDTDDDEVKYNSVANKFSADGGQSLTYIEEQLNNLGFDVSVSLNLNPTVDPSQYTKEVVGISLGKPRAFLNALEANLGGGRTGGEVEFIVNYLDKEADSIYKDKYLITEIHQRWKYAFFIHKKNGNRDEPANIPSKKKDLFRRTVLESKNFGTWAIAFVRYQ